MDRKESEATHSFRPCRFTAKAVHASRQKLFGRKRAMKTEKRADGSLRRRSGQAFDSAISCFLFPIACPPRPQFPDLFDQLLNLLPFAVAHVQEADSHIVTIVNGLDDAAQPEG